MLLRVKRRLIWKRSTLSEVFVNGSMHRECFVLEDRVRSKGEKVFGETAIPCGLFVTVIDHSPKFNRELPRLVGVPNFEGIRWHSGLTIDHTNGCLLTGDEYQVIAPGDLVAFLPGTSRPAFDRIFMLMCSAKERGEPIFTSVEEEPGEVK